jgi:hypothetical protein
VISSDNRMPLAHKTYLFIRLLVSEVKIDKTMFFNDFWPFGPGCVAMVAYRLSILVHECEGHHG